MLGEAEVDAVVIATPHTQHSEHIRAALQAGKHVLCEKPMATTAGDARAAIELAERQGVHPGHRLPAPRANVKLESPRDA
jgi:predicted dehydrogenase